MDDFQRYLNEQMKDEVFAEEYRRLEPEREYISAIIEARNACNMSQKQLSEKSGIRQSNISRIENGMCSPTVATLAKIADGLGKRLVIEFR